MGASLESSNAGGPVDDCDMLNADPPGTAINCLPSSGAVYLFNRQTDNRWLQQAYLKASDAGVYDYFGGSVALSADGSTLAVGARRQRSDAGANGGPIADCDTVLPDTPTNCKSNAGATYVFQRHTNDSWSQQVYLKAPNVGASDYFGQTVALSADGVTVAVGATGENSDTGVNGGPVDDCLKPIAKQLNCQRQSGAVYVY
ncbi:MAG: FG-GAP repeat protein [Thiohalomonadales bacterium]